MDGFVYVINTYKLLDKNHTNPFNNYLINKYLWNFNKFFIFVELLALNYGFGWSYFVAFSCLIVGKIILGFLIFFKPISFTIETMAIINFNGSFFEEYTSLLQDLSKILYYLMIIFCLTYPSPKNLMWFLKCIYFFIYLGLCNYYNIYFLKKYQKVYPMHHK
jgi:hypothetical protein